MNDVNRFSLTLALAISTGALCLPAGSAFAQSGTGQGPKDDCGAVQSPKMKERCLLRQKEVDQCNRLSGDVKSRCMAEIDKKLAAKG
jgi:hypothetical protein